MKYRSHYQTRYLDSISDDSNPKQVLIDENNRAYGVQYYQHGQYRTATASKEVILSSGSIQSAKLLMLSGIGPKDHLEELGVILIMWILYWFC